MYMEEINYKNKGGGGSGVYQNGREHQENIEIAGSGVGGPPSRNNYPYKRQVIKDGRKGKGGKFASRPLRLGSLNVRGCSSDMGKAAEIGEIFVERNYDVLALSETKIKGVGEHSFGKILGRVSGVRRGRAKEGVAILISKRMQEYVVGWKEVSSRIMWVKMRIRGELWCFISAYGPGSERDETERENFWDTLDRCVGGLGNGVKVLLMGDLNARVGDEVVEGVTGRYGVPGMNESGERLIGLCTERELIVANTWFRKHLNHKYTWQRQAHGNVVDRALMDYIIISKECIGRLLDVNVLRGAGRGISDHFLVEGKLVVGVRWGKTKTGEKVRRVLKVGELGKEGKSEEFQELLNKDWRELRDQEVGDVEEEWGKFRTAVVGNAEKVCGMRRVGGGVKRGSEWWCQEVKEAIERKKKAFDVWLQRKTRTAYEHYKECRAQAKREVKLAKMRADERWGRKLTEDVKENKKMFWKEVKRTRKESSKREEQVKAEDGRMLIRQEEVSRRWGDYFENLLNVSEEGEAEIRAVGNGTRMKMLGETNETAITKEEVQTAVNELKNGKAPGLDGCVGECLKAGGASIVEWLVRLLNVCFVTSVVPLDWMSACIVPLYKGKGDRHECANYRGISLLSVVGKVYGKILIKRVRDGTDAVICDVQGGFRRGRGCVDQVFVVRQICEKYLMKGKEVFWAFMDLEKAYDRVDREGMWDILKVYGVGGRLFRAIKSFYNNSRACVRVGEGVSDWFPVNVGLRQGCVMSPWLFNIYMDGVVREVNARVIGKGVVLVTERGEELRLKQLLFADDTALVAATENGLVRLVEEFGKVCKRRKLKVNVGKSKVMRCARVAGARLNVKLNGEELEQVEYFKYLGSTISREGGEEAEIKARVTEAGKVLGGMNRLFVNKALKMNIKRMLYEGIVVPTALYGAETWSMREADRKRLNSMEMRCLRRMCKVSRVDQYRNGIRNTEIRRRTGVTRDLAGRADQSMLRWFGHVERMEGDKLVKKVVRSRVGGVNLRGRPRIGWLESVKKAAEKRGRTLGECRELALDRRRWRGVVDE